jgi:hypothetical protein
MKWRNESIDPDKLREISIVSSMYHSQIRRFVDAFGIESVKLVRLDDLASEPNSCMRNIFRFIDVDPVSVEDAKRENQTREVTNLELMLRKTPLWNLEALFPDALKSRLRDIWSTFSDSPETEVLTEIDEERIHAMCEDALRLEDLYGIDLTAWRRAIARSSLIDEIEDPQV